LELSLNLVVAILAIEPTRLRKYRPRDPFEIKVEYLGTVSRSRLLKHDWWRAVQRIASESAKLNKQYSDAAMSTVYSRGGGYLEEMMRPIAQELAVPPPSLALTPAKIDAVGTGMKELAREATELATLMIAAVKRLSIASDRTS